MSIWGKIGGAAAGLALGGPLGALVGAVAGHFVVDRDRSEEAEAARAAKREEKRRIAFTIGMIALSAKMAKADGVVTADEVKAFKDLFEVPEAEYANVQRMFDLAKGDVRGYEAYALQLKSLFDDEPAMLEDVLGGLFHIAKADGVLHEAEGAYLETVASLFGFSQDDFQRIRAMHVRDEENPYVVLGIDPSASNAEIKKHYRKLVAENHPDKLIARGVPEEFIAIANEKLAGINSAYDRIQKERGI
ncbi:MAG: DnaJ family molecular chaperone [Pseudomonadota bacterium]